MKGGGGEKENRYVLLLVLCFADVIKKVALSRNLKLIFEYFSMYYIAQNNQDCVATHLVCLKIALDNCLQVKPRDNFLLVPVDFKAIQ